MNSGEAASALRRGGPLAAGAISLRMYPHSLAPDGIVEEMRVQARAAEAAGFDGVMTSEHHGGFPGYLPNPLLAAGALFSPPSQPPRPS